MIISSATQLEKYRQVAKISTEILSKLHQKTKEGITPLEIDALADQLCTEYRVTPNFKGVGPKNNAYQYVTCISVNDTVVHGIPQDEPLKKGDLVKVDFGLTYQGLNTDHCFTLGIGRVSAEDQKLLSTGRKAVLKAAQHATSGQRAGDLGYLMESIAAKDSFTVAKQYVGHGIGVTLHESPQLPAWGEPGTGSELKKGMVLCIEAQVIAGDSEVYTSKDGWSVKTSDGSNSVMFEFMVIVADKQPIFLTPTMDWSLIT